MRKTIVLAVLGTFLCTGVACASTTPASVSSALQAVEADNSVIQTAAQSWSSVQQQAANYAALSRFASQAGQGPQVQTVYGLEQCHNAHWDGNDEIQPLITGGLNLAGDAEAEAYALQVVDTQYVMDVGRLMDAMAQTNSGTMPPVQDMESSANDLNAELSTIGNQLTAAMGPNSTFQPLPLSHWQAGIGNYPNLSAVQWVPGPSDGAPMGWMTAYDGIGIRHFINKCPTGQANIPEISDAGILSAVHTALQDEPDMAAAFQSVQGGSAWTPQGFSGGSLGLLVTHDYQQRVQLVRVLGADVGQVADYMAPANHAVATFAQEAQQMTQNLQSAQ